MKGASIIEYYQSARGRAARCGPQRVRGQPFRSASVRAHVAVTKCAPLPRLGRAARYPLSVRRGHRGKSVLFESPQTAPSAPAPSSAPALSAVACAPIPAIPGVATAPRRFNPCRHSHPSRTEYSPLNSGSAHCSLYRMAENRGRNLLDDLILFVERLEVRLAVGIE
jgi:hypothetical protein